MNRKITQKYTNKKEEGRTLAFFQSSLQPHSQLLRRAAIAPLQEGGFSDQGTPSLPGALPDFSLFHVVL